jgi:hypothetical protein
MMNRWIERIFWILLTITLLWFWNQSDTDTLELSHLLEEQQERLVVQNAQLDSLSRMLQQFPEDPDAALKQDLMNKPGVISIPGIHGSSMRIFSIDDIQILNESWAYAEFEDGHIRAGGLFSYTRSSDGSIVWKLNSSVQF